MSVRKELQQVGVKTVRIPSELIEMPESQIIIERLAAMGYTFRLNLCSDSVEVNNCKITDIIAAEIRVALRDNGLSKKIKAAEDAYIAHAKKNAYHPIREYLDNLKWNGEDHIWRLAGYMESDDPPITYDDGETLPLHYVYLYRWLIGSVAKIYDQAQLAMLVMSGPQDTGKSTLARWLCPLSEYFIESAIRPDDKDFEFRLTDKWVWEVGELDATTRKADQSALKDFITRKEVTQRKAFGRYETQKPAMAALIGTVNPSTGFLTDETGNRRFMITSILKIDWNYQTIDPHQIWAQAKQLYSEKRQEYRLATEERQAQRDNNKRYEVETVLSDWLDEFFIFDPSEQDTFFSAAEILKEMATDFRMSGSERAQAMELARVLTSKGALRVHTVSGNRWAGMYRRIRD